MEPGEPPSAPGGRPTLAEREGLRHRLAANFEALLFHREVRCRARARPPLLPMIETRRAIADEILLFRSNHPKN